MLIVDDRGGNDPAIVFDDVDIDDVAPKVSCMKRAIRILDTDLSSRLLDWHF